MRTRSCCVTVYIEEGYTTACVREAPARDRLLITGTDTPDESVREVCHFLRDERLTVAGIAFVMVHAMSPKAAIRLVRQCRKIYKRIAQSGGK